MKNKSTGFGVGIPSIINIMIILCLTTFALLCFSSSRQNLRYAERAAEYAKQNSEAESKATQILSQIDLCLLKADNSNYAEGVYDIEKIEGTTVTFRPDCYKVTFSTFCGIDRTFCVELLVPLKPSSERYRIVKWHTELKSLGIDNNNQNIWDGKTF